MADEKDDEERDTEKPDDDTEEGARPDYEGMSLREILESHGIRSASDRKGTAIRIRPK